MAVCSAMVEESCLNHSGFEVEATGCRMQKGLGRRVTVETKELRRRFGARCFELSVVRV